MHLLSRLFYTITIALSAFVVIYAIQGILTVTKSEDLWFECLNLGISKMQARQAFASWDMKAYKQAKIAIRNWSKYCD